MSATGLEPMAAAAPVGAVDAPEPELEAEREALLMMALVEVADSVAVETVEFMPLDMEAEPETLELVVALPGDAVMVERTDSETEAAEALDKAEAEIAEDTADGLPPVMEKRPE